MRSTGLVRRASLAAILLLPSCIDFIEPDLPDRGAPAVIQATLRLLDDSILQVDARLAPGFDEVGLGRRITRETLRVAGRDVPPDSVLRNGTHVYRTDLDVAPLALGAIVFEAPVVRDVASPPAARWFPVRRAGADSLELAIGEDLVLTTAPADGSPEPPPTIQQWTLSLVAGGARFTIAASGVPPDTIVIPARWLPGSPNGAILARLVYQQTADLRAPPGDYIGLITFDTRIGWTILLSGSMANRARQITREAHDD